MGTGIWANFHRESGIWVTGTGIWSLGMGITDRKAVELGLYCHRLRYLNVLEHNDHLSHKG